MNTWMAAKRIAVGAMLASACLTTAQAESAADDKGFYLGLRGGVGFGLDTDADTKNVAGGSGATTLEPDVGFMTSAAFGYRYNPNISAEVEWVYRSNGLDSVTLPGGARASEGDFASNTFFVNGFYSFPEALGDGLTPFVGAGLGYVEEADIDLTVNGTETSYSSDGSIAYQLIAGARYDLNESFAIVGDLRFSQAPGLDLRQESGGNGRLDSVSQTNISSAIGLEYRF